MRAELTVLHTSKGRLTLFVAKHLQNCSRHLGCQVPETNGNVVHEADDVWQQRGVLLLCGLGTKLERKISSGNLEDCSVGLHGLRTGAAGKPKS
jgi:hypothetical protein